MPPDSVLVKTPCNNLSLMCVQGPTPGSQTEPADCTTSGDPILDSGRPATAVWKAYAVRVSTTAKAKMVLPEYQVEKSVVRGKFVSVYVTLGAMTKDRTPNLISIKTAS